MVRVILCYALAGVISIGFASLSSGSEMCSWLDDHCICTADPVFIQKDVRFPAQIFELQQAIRDLNKFEGVGNDCAVSVREAMNSEIHGDFGRAARLYAVVIIENSSQELSRFSDRGLVRSVLHLHDKEYAYLLLKKVFVQGETAPHSMTLLSKIAYLWHDLETFADAFVMSERGSTE